MEDKYLILLCYSVGPLVYLVSIVQTHTEVSWGHVGWKTKAIRDKRILICQREALHFQANVLASSSRSDTQTLYSSASISLIEPPVMILPGACSLPGTASTNPLEL